MASATAAPSIVAASSAAAVEAAAVEAGVFLQGQAGGAPVGHVPALRGHGRHHCPQEQEPHPSRGTAQGI